MTICDRCERPSRNKVVRVESRSPTGASEYLFSQETSVDLCPNCLERLADLVREFMLSKEPREA